jgi:RNA polymerase sigma-70 factor (ECF subfamily)
VDTPNAEWSDEALCERVANKDEAAFDALVGRYQQRAYRLAWSVLRNVEDARDVSQEAFIRLYQTAGTFQGRARFSTWFYRIVVNLCLDHRRKHRWWRWILVPVGGGEDPQGPPMERQPAPAVDPLDDLGRQQAMTELWRAVDRLSPQQRAVLVLQVQEEMETAQIAAVLRCSEATVRVHLHRALVALRKSAKRD